LEGALESHVPNLVPDDDFIGLAAQIHAAPGTYALLLGAGVSIAAGIKTGWQILEDLCRKLAAGKGVTTDDPTTWYENEYGKPANYSTVLEQLAETPAGRNALVRAYIDPSREELEDGKKAPTKAHRAIARMVRKGWVRLILTLNFDDLLERALRDEGVTPVVIASAKDIATKPPYVHNSCTLIKLHGHYTDFTTLNTGQELNAYAKPTQGLLGRILTDFGLVTCGWSGQWDTALIKAIKSAKSPYQLFFASKGQPGANAQGMLGVRNGKVLQIESADGMFEMLEDIAEAIEMLNVQQPLTVDLAVALTKRYLSEPKYRLAHRDLLLKSARQVLDTISDQSRFPTDTNDAISAAMLSKRWQALTDVTSPLAGMLCTTTSFGDVLYQEVVRDCIELLGTSLRFWKERGNITLTSSLTLPFVLALYSAGIGAMLSENSAGLNAVISKPRLPLQESVVYDVHPDMPFAKNTHQGRILEIHEAGNFFGFPNIPNEKILLRLIKPALDSLGYSELRVQEALNAFSYHRHFLAFRETAQILAKISGDPTAAVESQTRAKEARISMASSICWFDRNRSFVTLRKSVGEIRRQGDDNWLIKALWDGKPGVLINAYRDWKQHMADKYPGNGFENLPDWSQIEASSE
jgi:SIR2-like domain